MKPGSFPIPDRLMELLADRAVLGLSIREEAELASLLRDVPGFDADCLDRAAAAADEAMGPHPAPASAPAIPATLRAKLAAEGRAFITEQTARAARPTFEERPAVVGRIRPDPDRMIPGAGPSFASLGWLAAAACLALAGVAWFSDRNAATGADPASAKSRLVASATDLTRWNWLPLGELEGRTISGEAVWSTAAQRGYLSFAGLESNDPAREQYQLWIFDPSQSDTTPIDGGVFNIPPAAAGSEIVIPIDPKLRPAGPVMFAITIEKPGGVVVSDRKRLILIARPT